MPINLCFLGVGALAFVHVCIGNCSDEFCSEKWRGSLLTQGMRVCKYAERFKLAFSDIRQTLEVEADQIEIREDLTGSAGGSVASIAGGRLWLVGWRAGLSFWKI